MLARDAIYKQLSQSYIQLLQEQIENAKVGKVDSVLQCKIATAYSLIKIYLWLEDSELDEWRDKVEDICECNLPCVNCNGDGDVPVFDPDTMRWNILSYKCEELDTKYIAKSDSIHCEDDGITTTQAPITTTFIYVTTTAAQGQECRRRISFAYKANAPGPNSLTMAYKDCNGLDQTVELVKGEGASCIDFFVGTLRAALPEQEYIFNSGSFVSWVSIGILPCGVSA